MRNVIVLFVVAMIAAAAPAFAAGSLPDVKKPESVDSKARLDGLFAELKRERNEKAAQRISDRILATWNQSGSANIDLMMEWAQKATEAREYDVALDFLDQVTVMRPGFAEGWNRRATVHFLMDDLAKAMVDIERTLTLEPRHYGALAGLAQIMKDRGNKKLALSAYERILAVYPMMREAQSEITEISDELVGEGI